MQDTGHLPQLSTYDGIMLIILTNAHPNPYVGNHKNKKVLKNRVECLVSFMLGNTKVAFTIRKEKFHYMVISDDRHRFMLLLDDRSLERDQLLAYLGVVRLVDLVESEHDDRLNQDGRS
ncbi:hypothetical protein VNO77_15951 [Canavalia gladiata]|uniref:Uncharacterized protein n=1 Tax=Canavalia gladiata TaxID=3824 RepID=A0AAN9QW55_CANGL